MDDSHDHPAEVLPDNCNNSGCLETVKAKYLIGCDGAHSWTRRQVGIELRGDTTDHVWGVMDIIPLTDFRKYSEPRCDAMILRGRCVNESLPADIRQTCAIYSPDHGSVQIVPREKGLVRLYVQLHDIEIKDGRHLREKTTVQSIFEAAQRVFAPYKLEYSYCDWWSVYQVRPHCCSSR